MTTMTGKAMTVAGPVEPDQLGFTLMHEHLYLDLRKNHWPDPDSTATELDSWFTPLDLSNLHLARHALPLVDNYLLSSEADAIAEVSDFARLGGGTLVDVTSRGLKRDVPAIARAAEAAGVNIVLGSGWYQKLFHSEDMDERTVESLTDEIVRDITVGIPGTGVRSGIIGEIGVNGDPITPNEDKNIRAAARASIATGATISFHSPPRKDEKHAVLDIVEEEGADLTRIILGHSDHMADDLSYMVSLLERGVSIQFDTLGVVRTTETGKDHIVATAIPKMIDIGFADYILLSQDVCWKMHLKKYGGAGYTYIQETFLPYLETLGVSESDIHRIMVENPRRLLTFVEPG